MPGEREEKLTFVVECVANENTSFCFFSKCHTCLSLAYVEATKITDLYYTFLNIEKGIFTHILSAIVVKNLLVLINTSQILSN